LGRKFENRDESDKSNSEPFFRYDTLNIISSWHCDAHCRHCYIPAEKRRLDDFDEDVWSALVAGLPDDIKLVCFTGGEPFLHPERLLTLLETTQAAGHSSTVVTNGLWAQEWSQAKELLEKAVELGLVGVSVSVDDYHRPELPAEVLVRLFQHACRLRLHVNVKGVGLEAQKKIETIQKEFEGKIPDFSKSEINLERVGTAAGLSQDKTRSNFYENCWWALSPLVTPDGNVFACCAPRLLNIDNPILCRANVKDEPIKDILYRASRDFLLAAIIVMGPGGLYELLEGDKLAETTLSKCEVCLSILNDPRAVNKLRERFSKDKELRKEVLGKHMIYEACYRPEIDNELVIP